MYRTMIILRKVLIPVFNAGQAIALLGALSALTLIGIFADYMLALHMGVGAYIGIVLVSLLFGLAPDEVEVREEEIDPIKALLASAGSLHPVEDCVWAPAMAKSPLFRSDWISIAQSENGKFILKGRIRDLRLILSEIRQRSK
jgi:hypothetical protein